MPLLGIVHLHLEKDLMRTFMCQRKAPFSTQLPLLPKFDKAGIQKHLVSLERHRSSSIAPFYNILCICIAGKAANAPISGKPCKADTQPKIIFCELVNGCCTNKFGPWCRIVMEKELVEILRDCSADLLYLET